MKRMIDCNLTGTFNELFQKLITEVFWLIKRDGYTKVKRALDDLQIATYMLMGPRRWVISGRKACLKELTHKVFP
jgi:hypothetical protein